MVLAVGQTISHYQILSQLGRGGMGIVYKAEDTKLNRPVALKVLSPHLLSSADDRARFYREARSAAALNHPNIATVHAVDETIDGNGNPHPFIAMEFIEGRTLREVIDEGPLKLNDAIRIATEIASALQQAHEKDIVHRDVKSANVMLSETGSVKVLDFGLAKTAQSTMLTKTGSTLGTAAYMSPEQAKTADVDRRTDLWSLGVVLYEMVAGTLPFGAAYEQAVVYSILNEDPEPLTAVRTGVPFELDRIVAKCLMKDPKLRYQHADDLIADLAALEPGSSATRAAAPASSFETTTAHTGPSRTRSWLSAGLMLLLGLALGWVGTRYLGGTGASSLTDPYRVSIALPKGVTLSQGESAPLNLNRRVIALSPNGRSLVFVGQNVSGTRLYYRPLDDFEARPITGTDGAYGPFFSPDGEWVAFYADEQLKKVSINGGSPVALAPVSLPYDGIWTHAGKIIFANNEGRNLVEIPVDGGSLIPVENRDISVPSDILPDGTVVGRIRGGEILIKPGSSNEVKRTGLFGAGATLVAGSTLLYGIQGAVFAVPFDPDLYEPAGPRSRVVDRVWSRNFEYQFSTSKDGSIAFVDGPRAEITRLVWLDRSGHKEPLDFEPRVYAQFELSPDGSSIAVSWETTPIERNIWILDPNRSTYDQLSQGGYNDAPIWTPDGNVLVYLHCTFRGCSIVSRRVGTSTDIMILDETTAMPFSVTPNGDKVLLSEMGAIKEIELDSDAGLDTLIESNAAAWGPALSPDGRFLAYTADITQQYEIWVEPYPRTGRRVQASVGGGEEPVWSNDGNELYYRYGDRLFAVGVSTSAEMIEFTKPTLVYEGPFFNVGGVSYDVAPDGRFLILESVEQPDDLEHIHFISNQWIEEESAL